MRRRDFLKLVATSTTGAVLFTGCGVGNGDPKTEFQIESPVLNPRDVTFGRDNWYATTCDQCGSGCGVLMRVYEGRAKKIEGNPDFPVNTGASCARAQAAVQAVYHPDRITAPMRANPRGSGNFQTISWDEAMTELTDALNAARGTAGSILMITEPLSGALGQVAGQFASALGARQVTLEPDDRVVLREATRRVFGTDAFPTLDLARSNFLVSFSADFLQTWISPVQFGRAYGEFRQGRPNVRGTYYYVGPQFSGSAASADKWLPINPGTEGLVALAMAQVMSSQGLVDSAAAGRVYAGINLGDYSPDRVAAETGLTASQIDDLARRFASGKPSVAIAGATAAAQTNGLFNLTAVFALNLLVGSVGVPGGVILNPASALGNGIPAFTSGLAYRDWAGIANDMNSGSVQVVLTHDANPVYSLPPASGFQQALKSTNVKKIVSFTSVLDETAMQADLVLPVNVPMEDWGLSVPDPGPGYQVVGFQQPVVSPLPGIQSRSFGDVLIAAAKGAQQTLPWNTIEDAVRAAVDTLRGLDRGNVQATNAKEYFVTMQTQGGWWDTAQKAGTAPNAPARPTPPARPEFSGPENGLYLVPFPSNSLSYGEAAYLPWMQALPDPVSTNVWGTWVELNPKTAQQLGVGTGDVVRVSSPNSALKQAELPVYVNPAAMPNAVLIPMGQGHTSSTRYAERRGANPLELIDPQTESETGALAWAATRVQVESTGKKVRIPRLEGQVPAFQLAGAPIVQVIPPQQ